MSTKSITNIAKSFQYLHPGASDDEIEGLTVKQKKMGEMAVEGTIKAIRQMVEGREPK
jgi:hypothetical protein